MCTVWQVSNTETCVKVVAADEFGNDLHYGGSAEDFKFEIDNEVYDPTEVDDQGLPQVLIKMVDNEDGSYYVCINFGPTGIHFVHMLFVDPHTEEGATDRYIKIQSSPLSTVVNAGPALGGHSVVTGDGIVQVRNVLRETRCSTRAVLPLPSPLLTLASFACRSTRLTAHRMCSTCSRGTSG